MILSIMDIAALEKKYKENKAQKKVETLQKKLSKLGGNSEDISKLSNDLSYYSELSAKISLIQKKLQDLKDVNELLEMEKDFEIKELALEEKEILEKDIEKLNQEVRRMKISRRFSSEDDNRATIIEIRAGAGGDEASLFAADLFRMYKNYASKKGWIMNLIDSSLSESGGYKEIIAEIKGKNVYGELKYESGVHRVQRIPTTESSGRIHTSTASVAILPEAKDIDVHINPEDLNIEVMRSSGAGGQSVNKTDSAVRITHVPSGITVSCQETKYQAQNKEKAMAILRARLYAKKQQEADEKRGDMRLKLIGSAMRSEKIRTYNFPQSRITDHRIKKSWFDIDSVLDGDLETVLKDVKEGIMTELLKEAEESEE
jgi:peptide chain release factor 1